MKLLFAALSGVTLFFSGLAGLDTVKPEPTVSSIHAFEEPLMAIGGNPAAETDSALISSLQAYQNRKSYEDVSAITDYLNAHPQSPWKFSLLANLGIVYRKTGHFSKAIDVWEQAWALGKGEKDIKVQALANRVAADLAILLSSLGRQERLESLLTELEGRTIYGSTLVQLSMAKENLWLMKHKPGTSFKCGPFALESIRAFEGDKDTHNRLIHRAQSSSKGFSLTQVHDLSNQLKMNYQMAKKSPGADFIVPSVAHWKSGHYAAILKKQGDFYLTKDPTFNQTNLVSRQALEDETSGYYLVPPGALPSGWQTVSDAEGNTIWGRGVATNRVPTATGPFDKKPPCKCPPCPGMATYNVFLMLVSLSVQDTPVGYTPPVGPDMKFTIVYNQLEWQQGSLTSSCTGDFNFGPLWNCSWLSYVTPPTFSGGAAYVNTRGGGQEVYTPLGASTTDARGYVKTCPPQIQGQATLWVNGSTYERRLPDGSKDVFSVVDGSGFILLSQIVDPQGNALTLSYKTDGTYRLDHVTDALGLVTTLTYGLSGDSSKVTQITDPYGRSAYFGYTNSNPGTPSAGIWQLTSSTDVIGIISTYHYYVDPGTGISNSVMVNMVTPYGTTSFTSSNSNFFSYGVPQTRSLSVTEPDGGQIYVESDLLGLIPNPYPYGYSDTYYPTGAGVAIYNGELEYQNTYYWDKKAQHDAPGNYSKARIYHWLLAPGENSSPVVQCEKPALESRIWYSYPGNASSSFFLGTSDQPTTISRVLDTVGTGTTQKWQYQYNNTLNPAALTAMIDPLLRQTNYSYDTVVGIDLTGVTQNRSGGMDTLFSATYNSQHEPLTITDAAGQTTTYTYNTQGQLATVTPPTRLGHSAETTTYGYTSNYLTSITRPLSGATTTLTYDTLNSHTVNRVKTVTDAVSYMLTYTYDAWDRVTQILYPDATTDLFTYTDTAHPLDLHSSTDRLGRTTTPCVRCGASHDIADRSAGADDELHVVQLRLDVVDDRCQQPYHSLHAGRGSAGDFQGLCGCDPRRHHLRYRRAGGQRGGCANQHRHL